MEYESLGTFNKILIDKIKVSVYDVEMAVSD